MYGVDQCCKVDAVILPVVHQIYTEIFCIEEQTS